ncbi:MAG: bifunctional precorrin-2 dehydrogenase/sirohydrochlorin ferrochelatase [Candidatus Manganitrophaceae bacterium]
MRYYPLFVNLKGFPAVVIGGGAVAERKTATLLKAGARVRLISPDLTRRLTEWKRSGRITVLKRRYRKGDLTGARLAFIATNDPLVNETAAGEAEKKGILFNLADRKLSAGFIVPASFSKGEITIAVSTGGKNPALAKEIRDLLKGCLKDRLNKGPKVIKR